MYSASRSEGSSGSTSCGPKGISKKLIGQPRARLYALALAAQELVEREVVVVAVQDHDVRDPHAHDAGHEHFASKRFPHAGFADDHHVRVRDFFVFRPGVEEHRAAARARAGEPQEHAGGRADHPGAAVQEGGEHIRGQVDQQVQLPLWRAGGKRGLPGRLLASSGGAHLELLLPQVREQVVGALLQALATARVRCRWSSAP